ENLTPHIKALAAEVDKIDDRRDETLEAAEIRIKYKGYIERENQVADKMLRLENIKIQGRFDYPNMTQISIEARQKLAAINPVTLAQASRIPGVSPSDVNVMLVLMGR
ncbi:MAG: tRNA uridine-5-carboxymethylaminomethyl(34) synthesis enzyme MnmG, partial [Bacteroidaceae bacterium]|nr:tRNA uridine-5-carboxymethylaminomethyl(34) synthesis enzyme MnmG [Bacteroidaceae bacterium]